jgi:hypothetical protein
VPSLQILGCVGATDKVHCPATLPANNDRVNINIKACLFMFIDLLELFLALIDEYFLKLEFQKSYH